MRSSKLPISYCQKRSYCHVALCLECWLVGFFRSGSGGGTMAHDILAALVIATVALFIPIGVRSIDGVMLASFVGHSQMLILEELQGQILSI